MIGTISEIIENEKGIFIKIQHLKTKEVFLYKPKKNPEFQINSVVNFEITPYKIVSTCEKYELK